MWLPLPAPAAVEYNAILHKSLHQLDKVAVMLLWDMAIDAYVFSMVMIPGKVSDLVQVHLEDVLAHLYAEGYVQELVPPFVGVKHCQM